MCTNSDWLHPGEGENEVRISLPANYEHNAKSFTRFQVSSLILKCVKTHPILKCQNTQCSLAKTARKYKNLHVIADQIVKTCTQRLHTKTDQISTPNFRPENIKIYTQFQTKMSTEIYHPIWSDEPNLQMSKSTPSI